MKIIIIRQKFAQNRLNFQKTVKNFYKFHEIKSPRKLQIDKTAKSAKIYPREN